MYHCACIRHDVIVSLSTQVRNHKVGNKGKTSIKPPGGPPLGGPSPPLVGGQPRGGGPSAFWASLLPGQPPSGPVSYKNLPLASFTYNFWNENWVIVPFSSPVWVLQISYVSERIWKQRHFYELSRPICNSEIIFLHVFELEQVSLYYQFISIYKFLFHAYGPLHMLCNLRLVQWHSKSVYISRAMSHFYGTYFEIWAGFGPVGSTVFMVIFFL